MATIAMINLSKVNQYVATLTKLGENLNCVITVLQALNKILSDIWRGKRELNIITNNNVLSKDLKKISVGATDISLQLKYIAISSKINMK